MWARKNGDRFYNLFANKAAGLLAKRGDQWAGLLKRSAVSVMTGQPDRPTSGDGDKTP